tara:strand:+ start:244 stop:477 length:234 start_codon:yes stop_codon:yes gene_type:complete
MMIGKITKAIKGIYIFKYKGTSINITGAKNAIGHNNIRKYNLLLDIKFRKFSVISTKKTPTDKIVKYHMCDKKIWKS